MLLERIKNKKIILGSRSPRRQELLDSLGISFELRISDSDENYPDKLVIDEVAEFLAFKKSKTLFPTLKEKEVLITADTIVLMSDKILEKPQNKHDAINMLKSLSGNMHKVITGVCISDIRKQCIFSCTTEVYFEDLEDQEINYYVDKHNTLDKAGAYGIQDWLGLIAVKKLKGCYYNVVGLPVSRLYQELIQFL